MRAFLYILASSPDPDRVDEILEILRKAQPGRQRTIDRDAVFGRKNKKVDGKRGRWLEIKGNLASQLITAITHRAHALEPEQAPLGTWSPSTSLCRDKIC